MWANLSLFVLRSHGHKYHHLQPVSLSNSFFFLKTYVNISLIYLESSSWIGIFSLYFHAHIITNLILACPTTRLIIFLGTHQQWRKQIYKNENPVEKSNDNAHSTVLNPIVLPYGNSSTEFVTFFRKLHHTYWALRKVMSVNFCCNILYQ